MAPRVLATLVAAILGGCSDATAISGGTASSPMVGNVRTVFQGDSNMNANGSSFGPRADWYTAALASQQAGAIPLSLTFQFLGPATSGSPPTDHHMGESGSTVENHYDDPSGGNNVTNFAWRYYGALPDDTVASTTSSRLYNAEIVILSIGTNNTTSDGERDIAIADAEGLLRKIYDRNVVVIPSFRLVVGGVLPSTDSARQARIDLINPAYVAAVATLRGEGKNVWYSAPPTNLVNPTDYNDSIHLAPSGQAKWGQTLWATAKIALGYP